VWFAVGKDCTLNLKKKLKALPLSTSVPQPEQLQTGETGNTLLFKQAAYNDV
jgi:hypothetical protein